MCWESLILLGMLSGSRAHIQIILLSFRQELQIIYALGTGAALEEMRLSKSRMREETDTGAEAMNRGSFL